MRADWAAKYFSLNSREYREGPDGLNPLAGLNGSSAGSIVLGSPSETTAGLRLRRRPGPFPSDASTRIRPSAFGRPARSSPQTVNFCGARQKDGPFSATAW